MKQYTYKEFSRILKNNGYHLGRCNGSHFIWHNEVNHISIPKKVNSCVARRLIKENNLKIN